MESDAIGLLDALSIEKAHWVGRSIGGMIAQVAASEHPDRVLSLTSIMIGRMVHGRSGHRDVSRVSCERAVSGLRPLASGAGLLSARRATARDTSAAAITPATPSASTARHPATAARRTAGCIRG
ncbi:alpha/beta fold hydrolase [Burkholderia ubonensis]|uniref:alpha/beta fold hydrolase n=1 Tax=Burkholderia ubonensis TaxID=101571 RepID=UPI001E3BE35F|nr:alpha/beta hydrolase [Burkholderia ubonensis]MDY7788619.1 alpha/beta hydrolase [Burkholderia ubonensis]